MKNLLVQLIVFYQRAVSPYLRPRCRYIPSCSLYMKEAIEQKGWRVGLKKGLRRLARCHPWGGQGWDPVK